LAQEKPLVIEDESEEDPNADQGDETGSQGTQEVDEGDETTGRDAKDSSEGGMNISYRVNIVDAQVMLIANPAVSNSEAIVLGTKQVLVSQQHAMTLQVEKVGMFLCRMDRFEDTQLRILDDFSVQTSLDMKSQGKDSSLTSIHFTVAATF
jgi:vacuolar protein sorting-associated protein 13A/C